MTAQDRPGRLFLGTAVALGLLGAAIRLHNAIVYPERWGFDGLFNERYVGRLLESLALPAPDSDWSTAHPPLFYYLSAGLARLLGVTESIEAIVPARVASTLIGLVMVALCFALVRRAAPEEPRRAWLAAGIVMFLPANIYMSAMLNEEILAATLTSIALFGLCYELMREGEAGGPRLWQDLGIGTAAGLALLTKFSGLLVIGTIVASWVYVGIRSGRLGPALRRAGVVTGVALVVGGWYYARNLALYGYIYPQDLATHSLMFSMPPGARSVLDYLYVPLATFTDPQVLNADLLRSVWGSTYVTLWYEGHGHFLPKNEPAVARLGGTLLVLALLPTVAAIVGCFRAIRRGLRDPRTPDLPMVLLTGANFAGYIVFTWNNPWFATVKASYMLGIAIPFAYFASEVLSGWMRACPDRAIGIGILLGVLLVLICAAFTIDIGLWDLTPHGALPGLQWDGAPKVAPGPGPG